jgi:phosphatidylglycerophosphate synthase
VIGGLVVQLASVPDGCDGEIARLKKQQSRFGSFFDALLDRYADTFVLAGAGYYAWSAGDQSVLVGSWWGPTAVLLSVLAATGNLLVSYTSAKSVAELGYRYRGRLMAVGRGRDLRLFVLFLGGVLAWIDPSTVLLALLFIALVTNAVVVARTWTSWRLAQPAHPFADASAVVFDFDGTIADTMPFLTRLAVELLTEHYPVEAADARKRYLETVGVDFRRLRSSDWAVAPSRDRACRRPTRLRAPGQGTRVRPNDERGARAEGERVARRAAEAAMGRNVSARPDPHAAPVCEPKHSPPLPRAHHARQPDRRDPVLARHANRVEVALQDATAALVSVGTPGHRIAGPQHSRPIADNPRILPRDERAARLSAAAEPPR